MRDMTEAVDSIDFPLLAGGFVYVFYFSDTPFYVGEADCFQTRMTDYHRKAFASSTDFNVGEAAAYFKVNGHPVRVEYWPSEDRYVEETSTIEHLKKQGYKLLNGQLGCQYRGPKETRDSRIEEQRKKVHAFCEKLIMGREVGKLTAPPR